MARSSTAHCTAKRTGLRSSAAALGERCFFVWVLGALAAGVIACGAQPVATPTAPVASPVATRAAATLAPLPTPTLVPPPTPPCGQPSLTLGAAKFRIETLARAADGSLAVPPDKPGLAYWIEGTNAHYVFALSPTADNLALNGSLKRGDAVRIAWGHCRSEDFAVTI